MYGGFSIAMFEYRFRFFFAEKVGKEEIRFTWGRPLRVFRRLDRLDFRGALRAGRDGSGEHYPHVGRGLELEKPGGLVRTWESFGSKNTAMVQAIE